MEFQPGEVYTLPEGEGPEWIAESVRRATAGRLGPMLITLFERERTRVTGAFLAVASAKNPEDENGSVYLEPPSDSDEDPREFPCRDLVGFRVVPEEAIDHSDELRGGYLG
jgi:hypothetical protein